jgi:acetylornithine deacetylase/succinyl-diaminopimelate desuccinylase-like protein
VDTCQSAINYAHSNQKHYISGLSDFIRIPSISTDPDHAKDVQKAAEHLADKLKKLGIEKVKVNPTKRHPIVTGEYLHAGAGQPTILVYGHYDVQPVDPIDLWSNDPFKPVVDGDYLLARGASDMKGQVWASLSAIESIMHEGEFPVNLKFVFEGEEEIGSINFPEFVENNKDLLNATVCLNPDAGMVDAKTPTITYGLRGLAYFELKLFGPVHDLHSGSYGGVVHNPAQILADLISGMHDSNGRITLPDFYKKVRSLSSTERKEMARLNIGDEFYKNQTGVSALWGEKGFTSLERTGGRPTLEVNGMLSGFTGEGSKTIIPAWAMAKISTRLVPDQDPHEVHQQMLAYLKKNTPKSVRWELKLLSFGHPSISDIKSNESLALANALETVWGVKPIYKREGGSISVVADMQKSLGIDSLLSGFGLPDDNIHAPNEHLHLPTWYNGIDALIRFFFNAKKA